MPCSCPVFWLGCRQRQDVSLLLWEPEHGDDDGDDDEDGGDGGGDDDDGEDGDDNDGAVDDQDESYHIWFD